MAMVLFLTCVGLFIVIVGVTVEQSARVRLAAIPVILRAGRPRGSVLEGCRHLLNVDPM